MGVGGAEWANRSHRGALGRVPEVGSDDAAVFPMLIHAKRSGDRATWPFDCVCFS